MKFLKVDETIIPADNIAYIRADNTDETSKSVIVATKNGSMLFFPREDPATEINALWEAITDRMRL